MSILKQKWQNCVNAHRLFQCLASFLDFLKRAIHFFSVAPSLRPPRALARPCVCVCPRGLLRGAILPSISAQYGGSRVEGLRRGRNKGRTRPYASRIVPHIFRLVLIDSARPSFLGGVTRAIVAHRADALPLCVRHVRYDIIMNVQCGAVGGSQPPARDSIACLSATATLQVQVVVPALASCFYLLFI